MMGIFLGFNFLLVASYFALSGGNAALYFQWHSFWLVGVGTLAVMFLISPLMVVKSIFSFLPKLTRAEDKLSNYKPVIDELAANKHKPVDTKHPIISYAQQLWEQGVSPDLFVVLLSEKRNELDALNTDTIHSLKNLAKYPPALGMVGTVMGMIELFSALDKNQDKIGQALSIAMTATLLGLAITNFIISPVADRYHIHHMKEQRLNTSLYEIMLLINSDHPKSLIEEEMKSRVA